MVDLLIPIGHRIQLAYNPDEIPLPLRGMVQAALPTTKDIEDFTHAMGGRDAKPKGPVLLWGPDGSQIYIMGAGEASAAEIQDLAYEAMEKAQKQAKQSGRSFDFNSRRERAGLPSADKFDSLYREALRERARRHMANPITDPARVPLRGE